MKETGLTGKRRSTTIAATPDDGKSQRKRSVKCCHWWRILHGSSFGQVLCLEQMIYEICEVILDIFSCPIFSEDDTPCVRHVVGNFLADMNTALDQAGCCVTLSRNHRSSQLIVDNSTLISNGQNPVIDRHFSQVTIAENTDLGRWQHLYTPQRFFFS